MKASTSGLAPTQPARLRQSCYRPCIQGKGLGVPPAATVVKRLTASAATVQGVSAPAQPEAGMPSNATNPTVMPVVGPAIFPVKENPPLLHQLPEGARLVHVSQSVPNPSALPYLLYLPDIDGVGLSSSRQWGDWSAAFDMTALVLEPRLRSSFGQLAAAVAGHVRAQLAGVAPERPVYVMGEGAGAVMALQVALDCRQQVNRLILVNPATAYTASPLSRAKQLMQAVPRGLPLPVPLPLALAPALGTSPQRLASELVQGLLGSLASRQPQDAVAGATKVLREALDQVQQISRSLTPEAFVHRLDMLEEGLKLVEPQLARVPQRTLVVAGGQDLVMDSAKEAERLAERMPRAFKKVLPGSGHALLQEPGGELLPLLREEGFYSLRRTFTSHVTPAALRTLNEFGTSGPVEVPTQQEVSRYAQVWTKRMRELNSPVFISTQPDGTRVEGLAGLPSRHPSTPHHHHHHHAHHHHNGKGAAAAPAAAASDHHHDPNPQQQPEGSASSSSSSGGAAAADPDPDPVPILFVGNHQLYAFDMSVMVEEVLSETGILMRGLAHPGLFGEHLEARSAAEEAARADGKDPAGEDPPGAMQPPAFMGNMFQTFGAVRVTPTAIYRLLQAGEAVLLYPGGVREGFKRKHEKYELFWPSRSEFVRMASRFGAIIVPVAAVGLEDSIELVLDSDELRNSSFFGKGAVERAAAMPSARSGVTDDAALDQTFIPPIVAPLPPSRWYFLFQQPIHTTPDMYRDREACNEVYARVRREVEGGISYLLRKREQDPYKDLLPRLVYENPPLGPRRQAPTFKL